MRNVKLYPYKMGSQSAKQVAGLLNIKRVKPDGRYVPRIGHTIINWGSSKTPNWLDTALRRDVTILNPTSAVKVASSKLTALDALREAGIPVPFFTTDKRVAQYWLEDGHTVVERHLLSSDSAKGVRIVNLDDPDTESILSDAPLYTRYIPKSREFRVHVFRGEIIDYAEKKKMRSERRPANFNKYICSNEMGWVFARRDVFHSDDVKNMAAKAVETLGLDFAAVDVAFYEGTPYILEVNTAPGIMGTTLKRYINTFRTFNGLPPLDMSVARDETVTVNSTTAAEEAGSSNEALFSDGDDDELLGGGDPLDFLSDRDDSDDETVTLTVDKKTARKLKALLAEVA